MAAAGLAVESVSLRLGEFHLRDLTLAVAPGEVLVLLGPNGAGKSVSLETIAGFHRPARGRIRIAGREVTDWPPERRRIGFVFQSFGLFPHRSVAENVAMGMRPGQAGGPGEVAALLRRFGIAPLARRRPQFLSPGEMQRTALARALASRPDLFLLDEPFSALDAATRDGLRGELRQFLRETGIAALFVTHDHDDALALADRVAVMEAGAVVQTGAAAEVFARPASTAIARFLGFENLLEGRLLGTAGDGLARVAVGTGEILCPPPATPPPDGAVMLCIRAENVRIAAPGPLSGDNLFPVRVEALTALGPLRRITLAGAFPLTAYLLARDAAGLALGQVLTAQIEAAAIHVLPLGAAAGGRS